MLPYLHTCTSFVSDAHKSQALACAQLGHAAPGATTSRYMCNRIDFTDTPPCYEPQIITLNHQFKMVTIAPAVKRKRA